MSVTRTVALRVAWPMHASFMHDAKMTPDTNKTALGTIQSSFDVRRHHRRDNGQAGGWCWWQGPCGRLAVHAQGQHASQARRLLRELLGQLGLELRLVRMRGFRMRGLGLGLGLRVRG